MLPAMKFFMSTISMSPAKLLLLMITFLLSSGAPSWFQVVLPVASVPAVVLQPLKQRGVAIQPAISINPAALHQFFGIDPFIVASLAWFTILAVFHWSPGSVGRYYRQELPPAPF